MCAAPSGHTTQRWRRGWPRARRTSPTRGPSSFRPRQASPRAPSSGSWYGPGAAARTTMLTRELLGRLPKAELHTHLDSCLRPETMIELGRAAKFTLPTTDPDALRRFMVVEDATSLEDYLRRFDLTIPLLQTPEAIERVAYEAVEDAARDNVRYLEVRYCPWLSRKQGLSM